MKQLLFLTIPVLLFSCTQPGEQPRRDEPADNSSSIPAPALIPLALIAEYPHDTTAFTEGLQVHQGKLYEGTGELGHSRIQVSDVKTGRVEQKYPFKDSTLFGEGINILNGKLYQLTYQNRVAFMYDMKDLSTPIKKFNWPSEGWGITNNGTELIISDGQSAGNLYFVNPDDFRVKRIIQVTDNYGPVSNVNELEYIDGYIFANVWGTTHLLKIDPASGQVVGKMETKEALRSFYSSYPIRHLDNVLNGIAWDSTLKKMYITGKNWPKLFEVRIN
jgi:glutaminyl-peptide cyclotransferase